MGWLDFPFIRFHLPVITTHAFMGFRALRVINEDRVAPSQGFGMHPHQDMEIITYVIRGAIEHRDSMGNGEVLSAGQVQHMSAGTGIMHSEFNPSDSEELHLYQIGCNQSHVASSPRISRRLFPKPNG